MSTPAELIEATMQYVEAERLFALLKYRLKDICDEYGGVGNVSVELPKYIWNKGHLYTLTYNSNDRTSLPIIHRVPPDFVIVGPDAG